MPFMTERPFASPVGERRPFDFNPVFSQSQPVTVGDLLDQLESLIHPRMVDENDVPSPSNPMIWGAIPSPTRLALNPDSTPNTLHQTGVPPPHSLDFLPILEASSLGYPGSDPPTQAIHHRLAVPPTSQAKTSAERRAKEQEARLSNGKNSSRRAHKRSGPYSKENKARNEAGGRGAPVQNDLPADGLGRERLCEYTLTRLLEASPQPMSKKAIVEAIRNNPGPWEAEWCTFDAKDKVNRAH